MSDVYTSISVVVPCHNAGVNLTEAVASVFSVPTRMDVQVVVVDDGSDCRQTLEAVDIVETMSGVAVVRIPSNLGVQHARNVGLLASASDLVMTLDSDDRLIPPVPGSTGYFDAASHELSRDSSIAFVHTRSRMFGAFTGLTISSYPVSEAMVLGKCHVPTSIIFRREEVGRGCRYDPSVRKWQDWSFGIELLARRWADGLANGVAFFRGPAHNYRVHSSHTRVSRRVVDEIDMVRCTVERHREYFSHYYSGSVDDIARAVLARKPDRFTDLLHMAAWDVGEALAVRRERSYEIVSDRDLGDVP